jgi:2-keto-myo-inositol isomerase
LAGGLARRAVGRRRSLQNTVGQPAGEMGLQLVKTKERTAMTARLSRRAMMISTALGLGTAASTRLLGGRCEAADEPKVVSPGRTDSNGTKTPSFHYCLNTATIREQNLTLDQEVEVAAKAGYDGIEPWIQKIEQYKAKGGSLPDLKKRIADSGLTVQSAIGFADWINDDDAKRKAGLEQMRRDMDLAAQIGGKRIAAPPASATGKAMDLLTVAKRYRAVLEIGRQAGVVPQLELWGRSKTVSRMGEAAFVLVEAAHPDACTILDVFHVYTGGSDFGGIRMFNADALQVFHMNDYPASPPREKATDADRIYPGDGVAPFTQIIRDLRAIGFYGSLSLELFNKKYYQQDPLVVARTGLEKMKDVVAKALA